MRVMAKRILLVGSGRQMGACAARCPALGIAVAECELRTETPDVDAVVQQACGAEVKGVYPVDSAGVAVALEVSRRLRLPIPPCVGEAGAWGRFWARILSEPSSSVESVYVSDAASAPDAASSLGAPYRVRPVGTTSGSRSTLVEDAADLDLRVAQSLRLSSEHAVLVQRAVSGKTWRVLGFKFGPGYIPVEALEETHADGLFRVPSRVTVHGDVTAADYVPVVELSRRTAALLPNGYGLLEFEIVCPQPSGEAAGPLLADMRLRLSVEVGVDALLRATLGICLLDDALRVAVGIRPMAAACQGLSGTLAWLNSPSGVVESVQGVDAARALPGVAEIMVGAAPGQTLGHVVDEATRDRLGFVVAVGSSAALAHDRAEAACRSIQIQTRRVSA